MTKRDVLKLWYGEVLPNWRKEHEKNGPDYPGRCQLWNDWIDGLIKDRQVPERAGEWAHPSSNERRKR